MTDDHPKLCGNEMNEEAFDKMADLINEIMEACCDTQHLCPSCATISVASAVGLNTKDALHLNYAEALVSVVLGVSLAYQQSPMRMTVMCEGGDVHNWVIPTKPSKEERMKKAN